MTVIPARRGQRVTITPGHQKVLEAKWKKVLTAEAALAAANHDFDTYVKGLNEESGVKLGTVASLLGMTRNAMHYRVQRIEEA